MSLLKNRASQREVALLCQSLATSLHAGIDLIQALKIAGKRTSGRMRSVIKDLIREVKSGRELTAAIELQSSYFPNLFTDIVQIGEYAGALPEALKALAHHYENNIRLRKDFLSQITVPAIQLVIAIVIIGGLIFLLGWIGESTGTAVDILGWGLLGTSGAMTWFGGWAMGVAALAITYAITAQTATGQRFVHRLMMGIPMVGGCMRDFAIARFAWAFHLTQNAGLPIEESLRSSLRATSNGVFIGAADRIVDDVFTGETLTDALDNSGLFPMEFIQSVYVGETSGTVPEALHRLSPQFEANARRSLQALATAAGWACWAIVAGFIIFVVFTVAFWYIGMLNDAISEVNKI